MMLRIPRWLVPVVLWILFFFDRARWADWHFRATILNDGVNSGTHSYVFTPGAGNVMIVTGGHLLNGDAATRNAEVSVRDDDDNRIRHVLEVVSVATGQRRNFPSFEPTADDNSASGMLIVSGTEDLLVSVNSLAVSENSEVALQALVSQGPPTVVLTSPTGATETETENRVV